MTDANDTFLKLTGYSRREVEAGELTWQKLTPPEYMETSVAEIRMFEASGRVGPYEKEYLRKDGTRQWFVFAGSSLGGNACVEFCVDISDRKKAEAALRKSEGSIRSIIESSPYAVMTVDHKGRIALVNAEAERLFGYSREELLGSSIDRLIPHRFRRQHGSYQMEFTANPASRPMGAGRDLYCLRKDGSELPVEIGLGPVRTTEGDFVLVSALDITERKRAEEHKEMLLNELNHRVKNTLATVQAIATQTFKGSALGEEATAAFHGRLAALSSAHSLLIGASWESAELRDVIEQAVSPHGGNDLDRFRIAGPSLRLGPKPALAIAMALHELCTNAAKYGALSRPEGHVGVTWTIGDDVTPPRLRIRWEESGGPEVQKPKRKGFGSRLIERLLAEELNGEIELDYRPTGVVCTVDASLPTIASTTNELV